MNQKINLDFVSLKFILNRNKSYVFSALIILVSIFLFFQFVVPEFNSMLKSKQEADDLTAKLEMLKTNLNVLTNVNQDKLDSQYNTLTSALPVEKDVIKILNSIYAVAQKTGVSLGNFSFKIGNISKPEAADNSLVTLSVPINSGAEAANSFIKTLSKTIPLSEIDSIKTTDEISTITLSFYYKPLGDASSYSQDVQINPISKSGLALIDQLDKFDDTTSLASSSALVSQSPVSTSSASQ
jgi:hypothetical protein